MNEASIGIGPAQAAQGLPPVFEWGLEVIRAIQRAQTPVLTGLTSAIAAPAASGALYVSLVLFLLWWIDEKRGLRLGILLIVSAWINVYLKNILGQPRPFNLDPSVGMAYASGYGAPSGHAQLSMSFWVPAAAWLGSVWARRQRVVWVTAVFVILLAGFSQVYLGLHFPTGILAGWMLGGAALFVLFVPGPRIEGLLLKGGVRLQNISVAAIALCMNGLFPQERAFPALFLGFCLGYTMMKQRFPFSARGEINGKKPGAQVMLLRCFTGVAGVAVLFLALRLILPGEGSLFRDIPAWGPDSPVYDIGLFVRYGILGFWASAGAPRLFQRMALAQPAAND
ncbi:MAG: phosphatase PAP2 family protein [Treponema sp.]|nr:phosphatase PAP2 family protein [Treponema sp.]